MRFFLSLSVIRDGMHEGAKAATSSFLRRAGASLLLGAILGALDAGLHVDGTEWSANPLLAARGLVRLVVVYGIILLSVSWIFRWSVLLTLSISVFTTAQALGWYYREHPQMRSGTAMILVATSLMIAAGASYLLSRAFGVEAPRGKVVGVGLLSVGLIGGIPWVVPINPTTGLATRVPLTRPRIPGTRPAPRSPNVLLLTFDTLRADHLASYGYSHTITPNLDALGREGVIFERAQVQAPLTSVSHASIFTSMMPASHGIRGFTRSTQMLPGRKTMAEILLEAGYRTGAIVAAAPLAPGSGVERGFETYDFEMVPEGYPFYGFRKTLLAKVLKRVQLVRNRWAYQNASKQTNRALNWIDGLDRTPFFLWVHYFDPHDPYAPPRRFLRLSAHPGISPWQVLRRSYLYDSEVMYLDHEVGRLIDGLRKRGVLDDTIIAGISDHGEGLGEHGYVGHSHHLFDEQLHSVFFMRYPPRIPAGERVAWQVRSIDLMPTLLEVLQLPVPEQAEGASLLSVIVDPDSGSDRLSISETLERMDRPLVSASDGRFKLILPLGTGEQLLFDLTQDPEESQNLATRHLETVARLQAEISRYLQSGEGSSEDEIELDPAIRLKLRSLGYLQ